MSTSRANRSCRIRRAVRTLFLLNFAALTTGCGAGSANPTQSSLAGTSWQLVALGSTSIPAGDRSKYTVAFGTDGQLTIRADCNRGRGTWRVPESGRLEIPPFALTRAMCPPGSHHDDYVRALGSVRSYSMRGGHLHLSSASGSLELAPIRQ